MTAALFLALGKVGHKPPAQPAKTVQTKTQRRQTKMEMEMEKRELKRIVAEIIDDVMEELKEEDEAGPSGTPGVPFHPEGMYV